MAFTASQPSPPTPPDSPRLNLKHPVKYTLTAFRTPFIYYGNTIITQPLSLSNETHPQTKHGDPKATVPQTKVLDPITAAPAQQLYRMPLPPQAPPVKPMRNKASRTNNEAVQNVNLVRIVVQATYRPLVRFVFFIHV